MIKIAIAITVYDRLDLLRRCVEHLNASIKRWESNPKSGGAGSCFVNFFFDKMRPDEHEKAVDICCTVKNSYIIQPEKVHLGPCLNILRSISETAKDSCSHVIKLDSDILVAPNFIGDLVRLANRIGGMSVTTVYGKDPDNTKKQNANVAEYWVASGSNFCVNRGHLKRLLPMAKALIETYKTRPPSVERMNEEWSVMKFLLNLNRPNHRAENSPHRDLILNSTDPNTASDAMITAATFCAGIPVASYVSNRAIHPSSGGVHTTEEFWKAHYDGVSLLDLPAAKRITFREHSK